MSVKLSEGRAGSFNFGGRGRLVLEGGGFFKRWDILGLFRTWGWLPGAVSAGGWVFGPLWGGGFLLHINFATYKYSRESLPELARGRASAIRVVQFSRQRPVGVGREAGTHGNCCGACNPGLEIVLGREFRPLAPLGVTEGVAGQLGVAGQVKDLASAMRGRGASDPPGKRHYFS